MYWYGGLLRKAKKMKKKNRGMCEGTEWATRQATRLRKSGKKKVEEGTV